MVGGIVKSLELYFGYIPIMNTQSGTRYFGRNINILNKIVSFDVRDYTESFFVLCES